MRRELAFITLSVIAVGVFFGLTAIGIRANNDRLAAIETERIAAERAEAMRSNGEAELARMLANVGDKPIAYQMAKVAVGKRGFKAVGINKCSVEGDVWTLVAAAEVGPSRGGYAGEFPGEPWRVVLVKTPKAGAARFLVVSAERL